MIKFLEPFKVKQGDKELTFRFEECDAISLASVMDAYVDTSISVMERKQTLWQYILEHTSFNVEGTWVKCFENGAYMPLSLKEDGDLLKTLREKFTNEIVLPFFHKSSK